MSKFGEDLVTSLGQAVEARPGVRVTVVEVPDVRAIRQSLHMSQKQLDVSKMGLMNRSHLARFPR